jgi:hypothetical protein
MAKPYVYPNGKCFSFIRDARDLVGLLNCEKDMYSTSAIEKLETYYSERQRFQFIELIVGVDSPLLTGSFTYCGCGRLKERGGAGPFSDTVSGLHKPFYSTSTAEIGLKNSR